MTAQEMTHLGCVLETLALAYREPFSEERKIVYLQFLKTLPLEQVVRACEAWGTSDEQFFPKPGQLIVLARALGSPGQTPQALQYRAEQAWYNLRGSAVSRPYNAWALADPITKSVFRIMGGGYITEAGFGQWPIREETHRMREFCAAYVDLATQADTLPPLPTAPKELPAAPREEATRERRGERFDDVLGLLKALGDKLSMPLDGVPERYLAVHSPHQSPYVPQLSAEEAEARRALLLRQAHQVCATQLASTSVMAHRIVDGEANEEPAP